MIEEGKSPENPGEEGLSAKIAEWTRQAETASQKAGSDAGAALTAKESAEAHAKSIASLKGQAEADASWFTSTRQGIEQAQAAINHAGAEAQSIKQALSELQSELEKIGAAAKLNSEGVDEFYEAAEKFAAGAQEQSKAATSSAKTAAAEEAKAIAAQAKIEELLENIDQQAEASSENSTLVETALAEVKKAQEKAASHVAAMATADKKANDTILVITAHEKELAKLKTEFANIHARIESLLPNATSAGLATAFREQKARFERPQLMWLSTFVLTILALLLSSLVGLPATEDSWDAIFRHLVNRLPLIAPLVWLAIYAGRHYGMALRLQEEYAYKEAVSAAFEGYKREMGTVGVGSDGGSPLVTLCENVLGTLGQRPGRIYEGKHEDITPAGTIANAAKDALEAVKGMVDGAANKSKAAGGG
ncbi:hypothetical protein [Polaromonas sp.]|uniref:hypothetical protein n=1 Tax=Polaromonas sp. TaxID=1869339 RepID=UPI003BAB27C2